MRPAINARIPNLASVILFACCILLIRNPVHILSAEEREIAALPAPAERQVDFADDIQPILAANCTRCHGADNAEGDLRLDGKASAQAGGSRGPAYEPGKSETSRLIRFVAGLEEDLVMPPEGERLSTEQIALLRAWIDQGAKWPGSSPGVDGHTGTDHWSFRPIRRPDVPLVANATWTRNPIDAFVAARLEKEHIEPSPEADRSTLIRRLYMDLVGLPPDPAAVLEFLSDNRPEAYEQLVERLLASPHYGERWGRHWLDQARYADSDGYEKDLARPYAWRYRDWVISALNRGLGFDQFTIEQLAGDLLPEATLDQKTATGFHRNTLTNREGGVDQEEYRVKAVVDRVNTTAGVWLGLTMACCECHSHKYDPLSQREYYGMFAFFNSSQEVDMPAPLPAELEQYERTKAKYDAEHAKLAAALEQFERDKLPGRQAAWEASVKPDSVQWTPLAPESVSSAGGAKLESLPDQSLLVSGENPATDTFTITVSPELPGITAFRLEVLPDANLPSQGPGRVAHGNFVLSEFSVTATDDDGTRAIELTHPTSDFAQDQFAIDQAIDNDPNTGWAIVPQTGRYHVAVFETKDEIKPTGRLTLTFRLEHNHGKQHVMGRFRLSATSAPRPVTFDPLPPDVRTALAVPIAERSEAQLASIKEFYRTVDDQWDKLNQKITKHARGAPKYPEAQVMVLTEKENPPKTHIHIRGDFLRPGDEVLCHTPAVLPACVPRGEKLDRLDLARWLVDPSNPLTARVTANWIWKQYFGRGLVATLDDFGIRGEAPSHPELLDWLASELMDQGWSLKKLHRLIVTSATYRQSSHTRPELAAIDPQNILLARQVRQRVEAEIVRDLCLATSGLLVPAIGGPSIRPPIPAGVADLGYANSIKWPESQGPDRYRRGLYIFFQRTVPYPTLMTFDAPDSNVSCARRERSNTPLQALTLLNGPVFFECAQALGQRIVRDAPADTKERLRLAYLVCLAREPAGDELAQLQGLVEQFRSECASNPQAVEKLLPSSAPADVSERIELATWVALARVLMNLDEFVTRE